MSSNKEVIQYLVDTRELWPAATKTSDLETEASRPLALLTEDERSRVLKYYFIADAKMALASHLLKHWVVSKYCDVPWWETKLSADANGKPVFKDAAGREPVVFNVSHQAGLVALVAVHGYHRGTVDVGVDVVCVSERRRRDLQMIRSDGWPKYVDMHAEVFGRSEAAYLKTGLAALPAYAALRSGDDDARTDFRLRAFYTLWCLREAYVKMTGEALLAEWLGDLVFRGFEAPAPGTEFAQKEDDDEAGQVVRALDVVFKGNKVEDANICIRSLGPDYMTCTAVRTPASKEDALGWVLGPFAFLDIEDIVKLGEASSSF